MSCILKKFSAYLTRTEDVCLILAVILGRLLLFLAVLFYEMGIYFIVTYGNRLYIYNECRPDNPVTYIISWGPSLIQNLPVVCVYSSPINTHIYNSSIQMLLKAKCEYPTVNLGYMNPQCITLCNESMLFLTHNFLEIQFMLICK